MNFLFDSEARSYGSSRDYRDYRDYLPDMTGAFSDWAQDRSGGGCCCGGGYGGGGYSYSPSLFSDGTLLVILAIAGFAYYVLYTTVTAAAGTGRRRRSLKNLEEGEDQGFDLFDDIVRLGRFVSITAGRAWHDMCVGGREGYHYYWIIVV